MRAFIAFNSQDADLKVGVFFWSFEVEAQMLPTDGIEFVLAIGKTLWSMLPKQRPSALPPVHIEVKDSSLNNVQIVVSRIAVMEPGMFGVMEPGMFGVMEPVLSD